MSKALSKRLPVSGAGFWPANLRSRRPTFGAVGCGLWAVGCGAWPAPLRSRGQPANTGRVLPVSSGSYPVGPIGLQPGQPSHSSTPLYSTPACLQPQCLPVPTIHSRYIFHKLSVDVASHCQIHRSRLLRCHPRFLLHSPRLVIRRYRRGGACVLGA
jgi:hypothetical protein